MYKRNKSNAEYYKKMMLFNKKGLFLFLCCISFQQILFAQVGNYTKVDKIYRDTYNFLETANTSSKQHKDKSLYIVYSDRDLNNAYLDDLGLKQSEKQSFLTPYFVINESVDFLELVKFDSSIIGKPKGILSFFYGDKYNFEDTKNVEYVGWIKKDKLLHFSHPKVSKANLKPLVYYLGINNTETLFSLKKYIKKDSISAYKDPKLKIKSKKSFNTSQFVYLYKYNANKTAALISNMEHMHAADSLKRRMGWVPSQLIKNIGQRKVWEVNKEKEVMFIDSDTTKYIVKGRNINSFIFRAADKEKIGDNILDSLVSGISHVPLNIWDHYNNKLINIKGGDVYLREVPVIKEDRKVYNLHFVFDCNPNLKSKLLLQISSLQRIWLLISDNERFKNYKFTFSASSYGCNSYYTFPKSDSFALWIDYLQKVFSDDSSLASVKQGHSEGIQKCLKEIIADEQKEINFENNIVLVLGNEELNFDVENEKLLNDLSKISTQFLFFQLENKADKSHQDYILKAKQILDAISKEYYNFITNYIIENELAIKENTFKTLESEENNIYLYDTPKKSMYNGGIVFPKVNKNLSPVSFDVAFDSLINKSIVSNAAFINSLENGSDKLGFLRSKPAKRIINILKKDSVSRVAVLIPRNNKKELYLETSKLKLSHNVDLGSGYLFSKNELEVIIESYKSIIPLIDRAINNEQRRALYIKYKSYYKQLNELLFYKQLKSNNSIGELIEIKTGIKVRDRTLNFIKISEVKHELSNEEYTKVMQNLRSKIEKLETVIENPDTILYIDGSKTTYYYVPEKDLL